MKTENYKTPSDDATCVACKAAHEKLVSVAALETIKDAALQAVKILQLAGYVPEPTTNT